MKGDLVILTIAFTCTVVFHARAEQSLAPLTVVIYNRRAPESESLAKFYAQQRGIARDHLVGLDCSVDEEITRDEYDATIAHPLRETFQQKNWWKLRQKGAEQAVAASSIRFVAIIKGVP